MREPVNAGTGVGAEPLRTGGAAFFAIALGWSWLFWFGSTKVGSGADVAVSPLFLIGGAGPLLAAVLLTHTRESRANQRSLWSRAFDPRRIRDRWWLATLLLQPLVSASALACDLALGGSVPALEMEIGSVSVALGLVFFTFWFGPLPEELGWRGFALDRLQRRTTALRASLILGTLWALWHLPLFYMPGTYQAGLGAGTARFCGSFCCRWFRSPC